MDPVIIADYNPDWPEQFAALASRVRHAFADGPLIAIEHVGSTSIAGLAAKPIIDIDVIIPSDTDVPNAITRLASIGYVHQGDKGVPGREAFQSPSGTQPHHLYLCSCDGLEYHRHIAFRDYLRANSNAVQDYEALKRDLAARFRNDRIAYNEGKTAFVEAVLEKAREQQGG